MSATITYPSTDNMFADSKKITLDKINQGGGSGGVGGVSMAQVVAAILANKQVYMDHAPADPNNVSLEAVSYDSATGLLNHWNINTLAWQ